MLLQCHSTEIAWNPNPETNLINYKVWREDAGNYFLLGSTSTAVTTFNLGTLTAPMRVCISATAFGGLEGLKSEVMVIDPSEPSPYIYVSLKGARTYTFAMNVSSNKRFFRFDVANNQATIQQSFSLSNWTALTTIPIGDNFGEHTISISRR
jgi:hypothetical protein